MDLLVTIAVFYLIWIVFSQAWVWLALGVITFTCLFFFSKDFRIIVFGFGMSAFLFYLAFLTL